MKRKWVCILILVVLLQMMVPALNAQADVIFQPDDGFLERNMDKVVYLGRSFYANGEAGFVTLKREPGSARELSGLRNGEIIHVLYTYDHNGEPWGIGYSPGWVQMDQLLLVYDQASFQADHARELHSFSGSIETLLDVERIVFWTWPGSGVVAFEHSPYPDNSEIESNWLDASTAYMDNEGREWILIPYFYASISTWVCYSDPSNRDIPAFNTAPDPELLPARDVVLGSGGLISGLPDTLLIII